jgi:hypothetical protein
MSTTTVDGSLELPDPNTNEADFQAAIVERIRAALQLLKAGVRVERYLTLKTWAPRFEDRRHECH